nr:MAG TPA: hypothetical protein [Bacteriophage sp.]
MDAVFHTRNKVLIFLEYLRFQPSHVFRSL